MAEFPKEHVVTIRAELDNAVTVRPGDKLVIGFSGMLNESQAAEIKQRLADRLPGVEFVLIDTCTSLVVYRDEPRIVYAEQLSGSA